MVPSSSFAHQQEPPAEYHRRKKELDDLTAIRERALVFQLYLRHLADDGHQAHLTLSIKYGPVGWLYSPNALVIRWTLACDTR